MGHYNNFNLDLRLDVECLAQTGPLLRLLHARHQRIVHPHVLAALFIKTRPN